MNVYDLIESCHSMEQLDSIRADVMSIIGSCNSVDEMKRIQNAFRKQKNRVRYGRRKGASDA